MSAALELVDYRGRLAQGDIYADVHFLEEIRQELGQLEISRVLFPHVYVLTQDCDLDGDHKLRTTQQFDNDDKYLVSAIVAPVYLAQHVRDGTHLDQMALTPDGGAPVKMAYLNSGKWQRVTSNQNLRYHYLEFSEGAPMLDSVIDFKHYFTVPIRALAKRTPVCCVGDLNRADVSQRFGAYLSRVGLPEALP